ncbi:MAG TPA: tandem-95 repeat protein, partial [Gammaproteobacteria bacterium]|nr:tandem-95 repeat protein [Gammaproteobacteria bacterium]
DAPTTAPVTLAPLPEDGGPRLITNAELVANAADIDGNSLTAAGLAIASGNGTLVDNGNGTWTYTPAADDSGVVAFLYTIADGNGGTVAGSATLDITPVNDAPVVTSNGGGLNASAGVAENTTAVTVVTSVDADGDAVQYSIIGGADAARFRIDGATGALTFLSAPNYEAPADGGADNIYEVIVRAVDGNGGSATQTLQIAVAGVDEAPTAGGDAFEMSDNQLLIVTTTRLLSNDADPEGGALRIVSMTSPLSGTLEQDAAGGWRYTPSSGFTGNDRFTYTVADASGRTATAEVVIAVASLPSGAGGAAPAAPAATSSAAPSAPSGPVSGGAIASTFGGNPLDGVDVLAGGHVDVAGAEASAVWTVDAEEPPAGDVADSAVADFAAEIERERVYDVRNWAPPDQVELEQIAIDMNNNLLRLALNMGLQDTSRSLAVFDETFQEMADGVRRADREVAEIAIGSGVAVGAGVIAWLLRGGALVASLLSALPAWASFDPVPILARRHDDERKPPAPPEDPSETAVSRVLRPDALPTRQARS